MDLDRFLNELAQEGERESSGGFTLDPRRAREKLKNYQQPFPYAFVGSLMAAAHLAGAPAVAVQVKPRGLLLAWSSPELRPEQIREIFSGLFTTGQPPFLRELGLGLNGALTMGPRRLEIMSGRWRHQLAPLEMLREHAPTPGIRIEIEYPWSTWPARQLLGRLPESAFLKERCLLAVPALQLNGQRIAVPTPDGHCLASTLLEGGPAFLNAPLRKALPPADFHYDLQGNGPHGGLFGLFLDEPSDFRIIVDGISFGHEVHIPGAWGYLVAPQLRRDLSAFALVEDETYEHLVVVIRGAFRFLLNSYAKAYEQLPADKRRQAAPVLLYMAEEEAAARQRARAGGLYEKIVKAYTPESEHDWNYFRAAYGAYLVQIATHGPTTRALEMAREFELNAGVHLKVQVHTQPDGCLKIDQSFHPSREKLRVELYQLDRLLLGESHYYTHRHSYAEF